MLKHRHFLLLFLTFGLFSAVQATHNRAGEITYKWLYGYTYEIKITTYTNIGGANLADRCDDTLYFGDGSKAVVARSNGPSTLCSGLAQDGVTLTPYIKLNEYVTTHTYPGVGMYKMTMTDPNRNAGVINIPNSVNQVFYIESYLVISSFSGPNSSPLLSFPPLDQGCVGQCFFHNPGAYDLDGDSLSYELTFCRGNGGIICPGYSYPAGSTYTINSLTGTLTWCIPQQQGEYNLAMIIKEWRKDISGSYTLIGYVLRDLQVDVGPCNNNPPHIVVNSADTCIIAGSTITKQISATDPDMDMITLIAKGGSFNTESPSIFTSTQNVSPVTGNFNWVTSYANLRRMPYQITVKAEDQDPQINLVDFKTFNVKIIPHAPRNLITTGATDFIRLNWDKPVNYSLIGPNPFLRYRIYRKTGLSTWAHANDETAPPTSTGFTFLGYTNNNINDTLFFDFNGGNPMPASQDYSYFVLAEYMDGSMSYVSNPSSQQIYVGVKELSSDASTMELYPNPTAENCTLSFSKQSTELYTICLFDVSGRKIKTFMENESLVKPSLLLNLEGITEGTYFITIHFGHQTVTKKIIKQ